MKLIVAVIPQDALAAVQAALEEPGVRLVSVSVAGEPGARGVYRGVEFAALWPRFRVEIVVPNDAAAPYVLDAVVRAASLSGENPGADGSVLMMDLETCVRIPTADGRHAPGTSAHDAAAPADVPARQEEQPPERGSRHAALVRAVIGERA